jgi:hypothetical protein
VRVLLNAASFRGLRSVRRLASFAGQGRREILLMKRSGRPGKGFKALIWTKKLVGPGEWTQTGELTGKKQAPAATTEEPAQTALPPELVAVDLQPAAENGRSKRCR